MIRVFSGQGGGAFGSIQAGMLAEYYEHKDAVVPQGTFGVSVGALNFSYLMKKQNYDGQLPSLAEVRSNAAGLQEMWRSLRGNESVYREWPASGWKMRAVLTALRVAGLRGELGPSVIAYMSGKDGVYDFSPLRYLVAHHLGGSDWVHTAVGITTLETGEYRELPLGRQESFSAIDAVMTSASIPLKFPCIKLSDGTHGVDGGMTNITPLSGCFRMLGDLSSGTDDEELWIFRCTPMSGGHWQYSSGIKAQIMRAVQVLVDNIDREDFERASLINQLVQLAKSSQDVGGAVEILKKYGRVKIYVIQPAGYQMQGVPDSGLDFRADRVAGGLEVGRSAMRMFLSNPDSYELSKVLA